nr:GNAT family N-acetyltransferase [uncultured Mucilaginibacter sp.]
MKPKIIVESIAIGQATLADIPQLKELGLIAYGQYAETLGADHWAQMQQNLSNEAMFADLLSKSTCFIARHANEIIGMAFLLPSGNPVDVYQADWSSIRLVAVHPSHQGKHIARTLTQICINQAISNGEKTIALHTSSMMPAAMHVYESFGFKIIKDLGKRFGQQYFLYTLDLPAKTSAP